jgi:hypothetical protein
VSYVRVTAAFEANDRLLQGGEHAQEPPDACFEVLRLRAPEGRPLGLADPSRSVVPQAPAEPLGSRLIQELEDQLLAVGPFHRHTERIARTAWAPLDTDRSIRREDQEPGSPPDRSSR